MNVEFGPTRGSSIKLKWIFESLFLAQMAPHNISMQLVSITLAQNEYIMSMLILEVQSQNNLYVNNQNT